MRPSTRAFVWGFLAVFALTGLLGIEAWPFSGFRLFSQTRTDTVAGWDATTVDASGVERPVEFHGHSWIHVAEGMAGLADKERMAVCRAWASAGAVGAVVEVRVYRTWTPLASISGAGGGDGGPPRRELRASCVL